MYNKTSLNQETNTQEYVQEKSQLTHCCWPHVSGTESKVPRSPREAEEGSTQRLCEANLVKIHPFIGKS